MMPSVTDIAGLNSISRVVLANAAYAIAGMARAAVPEVEAKPLIGLTMFGVTTPAVTQAVEQLRGDYDCLVFHATGTGGRAMEKLVDSGLIGGVIDVTTTEICDLLFDGVLSAGPDRLGAIARTKCPMSARSALSTWSISEHSRRCRRSTASGTSTGTIRRSHLCGPRRRRTARWVRGSPKG